MPKQVLDRWNEIREALPTMPLSEHEEALLEKLAAFTEAELAQRKLAELFLEDLVFELRFPGRGDPEGDRGVSWGEIGEALGTTGEAARQRFGKRVKRRYVAAMREWVAAWVGVPEDERRAIVELAQLEDD